MMLKKFLLKLSIFSTPFLLFAGVIISMGLTFGDLLPVSAIVRIQTSEGAAYHVDGSQQDIINYKQQMALYRDPDVLVLGSSRFFFMREQFVTDENYSLYNATVPGVPPTTAYEILVTLVDNDTIPDVVIINFDLAWFNGDRTDMARFPQRVDAPDMTTDVTRQITVFQNLAMDFIVNPASVWSQLELHQQAGGLTIGRDTQERGQLDRTFRADGSIVRDTTPRQAADGVTASYPCIEDNISMCEVGTTVDETALQTVHDLLMLAQANDIVLIGVLPPYHPDFYAYLSDSSEHSYYNDARNAIAQLFEEVDMPFEDFSDGRGIGIETLMFYDAWHLNETGTLQMFLAIARNHPELFDPYTDTVILQRLLDNTETDRVFQD